MSTASVRVVPVLTCRFYLSSLSTTEKPRDGEELTSNSSGARKGIEQCSAARSCCIKAILRSLISILAGSADPKSIKIGVTPSSEIMMFACLWKKRQDRFDGTGETD